MEFTLPGQEHGFTWALPWTWKAVASAPWPAHGPIALRIPAAATVTFVLVTKMAVASFGSKIGHQEHH